jgi:hypothetical protein
VLFIGPISSIFDYATYFTMLYVFNAWNNPALFQTGWFVESLLTLYCGPVLRHPAELMLPAVDLGGRVWLGGRSCKGGPAAPAFGG